MKRLRRWRRKINDVNEIYDDTKDSSSPSQLDPPPASVRRRLEHEFGSGDDASEGADAIMDLGSPPVGSFVFNNFCNSLNDHHDFIGLLWARVGRASCCKLFDVYVLFFFKLIWAYLRFDSRLFFSLKFGVSFFLFLFRFLFLFLFFFVDSGFSHFQLELILIWFFFFVKQAQTPPDSPPAPEFINGLWIDLAEIIEDRPLMEESDEESNYATDSNNSNTSEAEREPHDWMAPAAGSVVRDPPGEEKDERLADVRHPSIAEMYAHLLESGTIDKTLVLEIDREHKGHQPLQRARRTGDRVQFRF
jgi:hypothetical protein